jgi:hypothetical protein
MRQCSGIRRRLRGDDVWPKGLLMSCATLGSEQVPIGVASAALCRRSRARLATGRARRPMWPLLITGLPICLSYAQHCSELVSIAEASVAVF